MLKNYKIGTVAMCDAVYKDERTNKAILAGLYSGDVIAERFPIDLTVSFYVEVISDTGGTPEIEINFYMDGKHFMGASVDLRDTIAGVPAMLLLTGLSMRFEKPCRLEMKLCAEGSEAISILSKEITTRDLPPSASPPLPKRSRRDARSKASKL